MVKDKVRFGPNQGKQAVDLRLIFRLALEKHYQDLLQNQPFIDPLCTACAWDEDDVRQYFSYEYDTFSGHKNTDIRLRNMFFITRS